MYSGKMCHKSITGGHVNLHTRGLIWGRPPNECGTKWLPWQRRMPSNRAKNYGLYYKQFDYVL